MSQVFSIGHVLTNLELRENARKEPYVRFILAESIGYGESARRQYFQVWAWDHQARRLLKRNVRKGSAIWVCGSLELVAVTKKDGATPDKQMKLKLENWDYLPGSSSRHAKGGVNPQQNEAGPTMPSALSPAGLIDGERDALPE